MENIYSDPRWRSTRHAALERDGRRCTVARFLGGECSHGPLHGHHIVPVADGGAPFDVDNVGTVCASHHPKWEKLRRALADDRQPEPVRPRCPHYHRTVEARLICEARLARQAARARDLANVA